MTNLKRCAAFQPGTGLPCGLPAGHDGEHTVLMPSDVPWFDDYASMGDDPRPLALDAAPRDDSVSVPRVLLFKLCGECITWNELYSRWDCAGCDAKCGSLGQFKHDDGCPVGAVDALLSASGPGGEE